MSYLCIKDNIDYFIADSNNIYKSNFGVVKSKYSKVMFDTSYSAVAFERIYEASKTMFLIISHNHTDHYLGGKNFYKYFKMIFCSNEVAEKLVDLGCSKAHIHIIFGEHTPIIVEGNVLKALNGCHSELDIIMYNLKLRVAFLGDLLLADRHPCLCKYKTVKVVSILGDLINLGIDLFIPGHGRVMTVLNVKTYIKYLQYIACAQKNKCSREEVNTWLHNEQINWKHINRLWDFLGV